MIHSRLADELKLAQSPVAILFSDERPEGAQGFAEGRWGCVIALLNVAAKGRVAVLDSASGCGGGHIGMGFCEDFAHTPGGIEYFLSTGRGEGYPEGERYIKTPEMAREFVKQMPRRTIPYKYIILKPLEQLADDETPESVVFLVTPDQLSALVVLANYDRSTTDNVIIPFAAGCQSIGILVYEEAKKPLPRAVVGGIDISERPCMKPDQLTFAVPYQRFLEMEGNVEGSFFQTKSWEKVRGRIPEPETK